MFLLGQPAVGTGGPHLVAPPGRASWPRACLERPGQTGSLPGSTNAHRIHQRELQFVDGLNCAALLSRDTPNPIMHPAVPSGHLDGAVGW